MPHNAEVFHPVSFASPRVASKYGQVDTRLWRNGAFRETARKPRIPAHWKWNGSVPDAWYLSSAKQYGGEGAYLADEKNPALHFVRLSAGFICQFHKIRTPKIKVVCKVRGKGTLSFDVIRYAPKWKKYLGVFTVRKVQLDDAENWKILTFEFTRPGASDEEQSFGVWPHNGTVDVAEVYLTPVEPGK